MPDGYTGRVAQLLSHGERDVKWDQADWPDYLKLGLTEADIPDLIRMVTDSELNRADSSSPEVWAPVHAWRALGQLGAEQAAQPLVSLFQEYELDDWLAHELPRVFSMIGPSTIPTLATFLENESIGPFNRITVPACLERIAQAHSDHRDACVGVLVRQLQKYETDAESLNAFIVSSLVDLQATEAIDSIREAFSRKCVDLLVLGDLEDVEILMGLRQARATPRARNLGVYEFLDKDLLAALGLKDGASRRVPQRRDHKAGRNDPCPCGSGKKFKKCCLH